MHAADDDEEKTEEEVGIEEDADDPFTTIKENTAGVAVKLLDFLFDLFSLCLDDKLSEFLTSDANVNLAVCQVKWEAWEQADLVEIRRTLSLHRMTVPASESHEMPAASTRGLKRSLSVRAGLRRRRQRLVVVLRRSKRLAWPDGCLDAPPADASTRGSGLGVS